MKKSKWFRTLTATLAAALLYGVFFLLPPTPGALTLTLCRCRKPPRPPQKCRRKPKNLPPAAWSRWATRHPAGQRYAGG